MRQLFRRFWNDDSGAIISTEWVLVVGIMIFGAIPGMVAVRNAVIASEATIGNALLSVAPSFSFSGFVITSSPGNATIAIVNGYQFTPGAGTVFQSTITNGIAITGIYVNPAP